MFSKKRSKKQQFMTKIENNVYFSMRNPNFIPDLPKNAILTIFQFKKIQKIHVYILFIKDDQLGHRAKGGRAGGGPRRWPRAANNLCGQRYTPWRATLDLKSGLAFYGYA